MTTPEDRREAQKRAAGEIKRAVGVILAVIIVVWIAQGPVLRWYQCRQLAPIERTFTRGC